MQHPITLPAIEALPLPEVVILANGDFPTHPALLKLLTDAPLLLCCDGAADACVAHGYMPHLVVGDGDSLSPALRANPAVNLVIETEQETNDLTKAVNLCRRRGLQHIIILGATGKREDHTLGNISLLMDYGEDLHVLMLTDAGVFVPATNAIDAVVTPGTQLSVFNFGAVGLRGEGLRYPLSDFTKLWQGTLNEATGTSVRISGQGRFLVYRAHG